MKLTVTLNSLYKYATIEEVYEIDTNNIKDEVLEDYKDNLGCLVLNGYGELKSEKILDTMSCKEDRVVSAKE